MKTKIPLLGTVLTLLVTFVLTQSALSAPAANTGGGKIYYIGPFPNWPTGGTAIMTVMNSDGTGKTVLGGKMFGSPSRALYDNRRWFIYTYVIPDQYYPDGITKRSEVFALREDFQPTLNNNATTAVQLTDDITLQPMVGSTDWVPGGAQICFKARRWSSADPGAVVVEGGLYTASLLFGPDGNIIGLDEQPTTPAIPFPLVEATPGDPWPALEDYSWNPTGTEMAYAGYGDNDLWIANLLNVHTRIFVGPVHVPQWAPDGQKIAFSQGGIVTINRDGTGFKRIIRNTSWFFYHAYFSPTGSHIVYTGQQSNGNLDLFRATATGRDPTNLTGTSSPFNELILPSGGGGWR